MSSTDNNIFVRLSIIVDKYFESLSDFCREADISRQYYYKMQNQYEDEGEEPDIGYHKLKGIISAITKKSNVSITWFLTGEGKMEAMSSDAPLSEQADSHRKSVDALRESGTDSDEIAEYLVKNREVVLKFLRSLEDDPD